MMHPRIARLAALCGAVVFAGIWAPNAQALRSYGTDVDSYCISLGTAAPIQSDCSVCHASSSYGTPVEPEWSWYLAGQSQWGNFCGPIVVNGPPSGTITAPAADQTIVAGGAVDFSGAATDPDGDPVTFAWAFPGGSPASATGANPGSVAYADAGTYTATLVVSDDNGNSDASPPTRVITVLSGSGTNSPPDGTILSPAADVTIPQGSTLTFTGSGSDPDGDALSFRWDMAGGAPDSTAQSPGSVRFDVPGTFRVTLTVTDSRGLADPTPAGRTVTVESVAPPGARCTDADGDLFSVEGGICGPADCDDGDAAVSPGAAEHCGDGTDNDCDGLTDGADAECDGSDCIGALIRGDASVALRYSSEPDRDPSARLDGAVVSGGLYVFVPDTDGIAGVRFLLDGEPRPTDTVAPWDLAGGSSAAANPLDTRYLTNGTHDILAEATLVSGETVAVQAGFIVNNDMPLSIEIGRAVWDARERELEVEGAWPTAGARVVVSNAGTGEVLGTTTVGYDDGVLGYELERSGLSLVPCRVRVEIDGRYGEADVVGAPADCVGGGPTPGNGTPLAIDDIAATDEDTSVSIPVLANDSDPDGDPLAVSAIGAASAGSVQLAGASVVYTPSANWFGVDAFTYTVTDGRGGSATATVSVTVRAVNDAPQAVDDAAATDAGTPVDIDVLANDTDVDGDALVVSAVGAASRGTTAVTAGGVTYTPDAGFSGTDGFSYSVADGRGGAATASVTVTVHSPEPPPPPPPSLSVEIDKAYWDRRRERLVVEGEDAPSGARVEVYAAQSGELLGTTSVRDDEWRVRVQDPAPVPCAVRVDLYADGRFGSAVERVRRAPRDCR
jgi:hypothetical protein